MATATYTKSGTKATTAATLDKAIFGLKVDNHELLKQAYVTYLANGRVASANTKTRGLVSGGGRKPWKQKGTGRARFGSSRNPIWRGGGIVFGPTGQENYKLKLSTTTKRQALKQALSLAAQDGKISIIETFECKDGKVKATAKLLEKLGATRGVLIVVSKKDELVERATNNLPEVKAVQANYVNVFDVMNAHNIVMSKKSLQIISDWLGASAANTKPAAKTAKESK